MPAGSTGSASRRCGPSEASSMAGPRSSMGTTPSRWRGGVLSAILVFLLSGCTAGGTPASSPAAPARPAPTRITAVVSGAPPVLYNKIADPAIAGVGAVEALVNAGLSLLDHTGAARARLAESLPSVE